MDGQMSLTDRPNIRSMTATLPAVSESSGIWRGAAVFWRGAKEGTAVSKIVCGDALSEMRSLPSDTVGLVFTSPPYFNARPYACWESYPEYLDYMGEVMAETLRVTVPGRLLALLTSPVISPRPRRWSSSERHPIPFDLAARMRESGWDFYDDIIWVKPEGAAGMRSKFRTTRRPLTYRPILVTEYLLVFRKPAREPIDVFVRGARNLPPDNLGEVPRTNVWDDIAPVRHSLHPAVFPARLAERVVGLYSLPGDIVLDPFGGVGTTAQAAAKAGREFITIDSDETYSQEAALRTALLPACPDPG